MKIIREFCGQNIEIELTDEEQLDIYQEVQQKYDIETFNDYLESEGYMDVHINFLIYMAKEMRDVAYDLNLPDGLNEAREIVLNRHKAMLQYFKTKEE